MKKGFTLIELIIVIAIIAVLAVLAVSNVIPSLAKGRDARRKSDLTSLQKGLELYYDDNGAYPAAITPGSGLCHPKGCDVRTYMNTVPSDPSPGINYTYCSDTTSYQLYGALENTNDRQIIKPNPTLCGGVDLACETPTNTCFGLSSADVNP